MLGVAAGIAVVVWLYGQPPAGPFAGERAPDFTVTALDGESVTLQSLRGKPVFVNFWATWCLPCLEEMPEIEELYREYPGRFHVVAVTDEPRTTVTRYLQSFDYTFPIYLDNRGEMGRSYLVRAMPTSLFIDERGVIRARHVGQINRAQMEHYLRQLTNL